MKACNNCVLNENYLSINFDSNGICNYCNHFKKYEKKISNLSKLNSLFLKRINLFKGKYDFDCLLGISGGKDSSYVLYQLKEKYNLNVLTYTFDNNFLTDYAKENISNLVSEMGVEHFFYKPDWDFHKKVYKKMMKLTGIPCKGCSLGAYGTSFKFAFEKNIPFVFHGRTPSQIFRDFIPKSNDPTIPFIDSNIKQYNKENQIEILLEVAERLLSLLGDSKDENTKLTEEIITNFFPDIYKIIQAEMIPEFLGYFLYHKYDENNIKKILENNLSWKRSKEDKIFTHADCYIHDAVEYIRYNKFGYSIIEPEISVLIRQGLISKKEALKRISKENALISEPKESLKILCNKLDLDCVKLKEEILSSGKNE